MLDEETLWDFLIHQDSYIRQEFGIGVVGIGALFFAYSQVHAFEPYLRTIIALVGIAGSTILWLHMFGAKKEMRQTREELKRTCAREFMRRYERIQCWRKRGIGRLYISVDRLMIYFMGLVALAWLTLLLAHVGVHSLAIFFVDLVVLTFAVWLFTCRTVDEYLKEEEWSPAC